MSPEDLSRENADLKSQIALLARLVELSLTLNSTLKLERLLHYIISAAAELLNAEAASILLYDEKLNELRFVAATGSEVDELAKIPVPLESSIAGTIYLTGKPVVINDVPMDSRHFRKVGEQTKLHSKTLVGVPMRIKDRIIGVLEAINKRHDKPFSDIDANVLAVIASQAAVAVENARLVTDLQEAYDDLGKLDKLKTDFIAIASHELRTPLGIILGYATFLRDEAQGDAGEFAKAVLDAALHMRTLIENMTNLRFLQENEVALARETFNVADLITTARTEALSLADAKAQRIMVLPAQGNCAVYADKSKIQVAISNLLNNAIRFTPEGGTIELRAFQKGDEVWVQVKDNGRGIDARDLETIFQGFSQTEDHLVRKSGGLGIGLAIVRGTMRQHSGRVWAESPGLGKGSTFTFTLPLVG